MDQMITHGLVCCIKDKGENILQLSWSMCGYKVIPNTNIAALYPKHFQICLHYVKNKWEHPHTKQRLWIIILLVRNHCTIILQTKFNIYDNGLRYHWGQSVIHNHIGIVSNTNCHLCVSPWLIREDDWHSSNILSLCPIKPPYFGINKQDDSRGCPRPSNHQAINNHDMGLLPDTKIAGCACTKNAGNVFPATNKRNR